MAHRIKTSLLVFLLLFIYKSPGVLKVFSNGVNHMDSIQKDGVRKNSRKLLELDAMLDYDDAGANPRHDPRKGKPGGGGGGKNP